jgi:hypothetical protein
MIGMPEFIKCIERIEPKDGEHFIVTVKNNWYTHAIVHEIHEMWERFMPNTKVFVAPEWVAVAAAIPTYAVVNKKAKLTDWRDEKHKQPPTANKTGSPL